MARWLSWLERRPVTAEVMGSSPIRVVTDDVSYSECCQKYFLLSVTECEIIQLHKFSGS